ncbi:hypothetical protein GCM10022221_53450 [Actinocorallia aurea]
MIIRVPVEPSCVVVTSFSSNVPSKTTLCAVIVQVPTAHGAAAPAAPPPAAANPATAIPKAIAPARNMNPPRHSQ